MPGTCIIGLQWGDEAKGKLVDLLTPRFDIVVRYQGGANAGHTVVVGDETYKLHHIPSGILSREVMNVVTAGVVLNPPMIANGALKNVSMIFGLHVDPHLATGKIGIRDGVTMASVIDFDLIIHGRGGHAARPQHAVDAIVIAAEVVESLQKIVSRETDPTSPTAVTFGKIEGGTARNVIADTVTLTGTARTLSALDSRRLPKLIKRTAENICKAHGARAEMKIIARYPVLHNSPKTNQIFERNFKRLFGSGKVGQTDQTLGGEDFACYLQKVPGAMFRLGVMNKSIGADKSWHSPHFIADEEALFFGTSLLAASVLDYLNE